MTGYTCSKQTRVVREWFNEAALGCSAKAYVQYLGERGYHARTIAGYFSAAAHFAHWLARRHTDEINDELIARFLNQHLGHCRCALRCRRQRSESRAALGHLLALLQTHGQYTGVSSAIPGAIAAEIKAFDGYLADVRGLSPVTRSVRVRHLRDFLLDRFGTEPVRPGALRAADVVHFMDHYTAGWAPASIKQAGISLRSYFAFRASRGGQTLALTAAVPRVAPWRLAGLPQVLSAEEIHRLLQAFDRSGATGQRDYAITRCLLDLGLRRTEVARLRLEDVDWRTGTVRIHAKGKRIDLLPLPETTARAIAAYLQTGRPQTTRRELFVRHRPPSNAPAGADIVRNAVRYAAGRCELEDRIRGTHILRHTLAGRLVQGGARFKEIADLLRHRSLDTTTIYAKVDLAALGRVALSWPGSQP